MIGVTVAHCRDSLGFVIDQGFELGVFMGTNDDSVRVVYDADGKPVGEWRFR